MEKVKHWQNIQNILSSIIKISLRTVDQEGKILVQPAQMPVLCSQIVANSPQAVKRCWQWFPNLAEHLKKQNIETYAQSICPLGLINFAIPLNFNNNSTNFLIIGPIIFEKNNFNTQATYRYKEIGIDEKIFFECLNNLPKIKESELKEIVEFLKSAASYIAKLNSTPPITKTEKSVLDKTTINNLLKTFLEGALKLSGAEFGSVMIFEKTTQELSIKDAQGLSQETINNTKLKPGEGLAGLTIENKKSLFVNEQLNDRQIRLRMHKPQIKSAFVIPVFYKDDILGVISVATAKSPNRFSDMLMNLLNELVGMTLEKIDVD